MRTSPRTVLIRTTAVVTALGAGAVIWLTLTGNVESDEAGVASLIGLLTVALVVLVFMPSEVASRLFGSVKSVTIGAFGIEIADYRHLAEGRDRVTEEEPSGEESKQYSDNLFEVKMRLEAKLAYMANRVLSWSADPQHLVPRFITVGSLGYDGYLNAEQTKRAYEILGMRDFEFQSVPRAQQKEFLAGADVFVSNVRAEIFAGWVAAELSKLGWAPQRVFPSGSEHRDLEVRLGSQSSDTRSYYVIPVFAYKKESRLVSQAKARLMKYPARDGERFVVVPPRSRSVDQEDKHVGTVTLESLRITLGRVSGTEASPLDEKELQ